jgi:uncharacterized LabA/DUF88 family protein
MSKVAVFVDIARQYHSVSLIDKRARVNYERYLQSAVDDATLHRAFAYGVQISNEANDFIIALERMGYETRYRQAKIVLGIPNFRATSNNLSMFLDIVRNLKFVDTIVIGSNDLELVEMINWIKEQGIKVIIYSHNIPREMKMAADQWIEIRKEVIELKEDNDTINTSAR